MIFSSNFHKRIGYNLSFRIKLSQTGKTDYEYVDKFHSAGINLYSPHTFFSTLLHLKS